MDQLYTRVLVISHAGVKRINRAVYALLKNYVADIKVVVPSRLISNSGSIILPDPRAVEEAEVIPLLLDGNNPRKYFYPDLPKLVDELKPDVIILENDPVSVLGFRLASWCKKNGSKFICQTYDNTPRGIGATARFEGVKAIPKNLLIHLLNYRMASRVAALLVVNNDSKEIFQKYNYPNVIQIPLGFDKTIFYPDINVRAHYRVKAQVDHETVLISFFGRLVKQKGAHLLLKALGALKNLKWKLLLDYNHDNEDQYTLYIRDLIKELGMEDRVVFFDADHYEIANYMRATDIMVAPSVTTPGFKEQYGRAVQEAMACGCVCVVSDSGHPKYLVGEKDLVFEEGSISAITAVLSKLILEPELRQRYRGRLQDKAANQLGIDMQVKSVLGVINKLSTPVTA